MIATILFYAIAAAIVVFSAVVAFSPNIVRSAFALLGVMVGVAGLFGLLGLDFLAAVQVMVYVGGIMILFLFAVMFTGEISDAGHTNRSVGRLPAAIVCLAVLGVLLLVIWRYPFTGTIDQETHTTPAVGKSLLGGYLPVLEAIGVLILITLTGAVAIARPGKAE